METKTKMQKGYETCTDCGGTGHDNFSCCGDDISDSYTFICPTCGEHCDPEDCEFCGGDRIVPKQRDIELEKALKAEHDYEHKKHPEL